MNVGAYFRVSTKEQSVEMQKASVIDFCSRNGMTIYKEYIDEGVSGTKSSRPQLDAMMKDIRDRRIDGVVCYKLDRLGRSLQMIFTTLSEFRNKGIRFISVIDGIDTNNDTPMTRAYQNLLGTFAQLEREICIMRVNDGLALKKQQIKEQGFTITKAGKRITKLGRPNGVKDFKNSNKKERAKSGYTEYWTSEAGKIRKERMSVLAKQRHEKARAK